MFAVPDIPINLLSQSSTLRRRINQGDWVSAKEQIMRWTRGGGRVT